MATIYIVSDYGKLFKSGDTLQLKQGEGESRIFPYKTEQLVILGKVDVTNSALKLLMHHKVDTVFLGKNGQFNGKIAFKEGKNVFLRQKQFMKLNDLAFKLEFAKSIVRGKLKNQLSFIQRIIRRREDAQTVATTTDKLKEIITKVDTVESLESLRGFEGLGARQFFSVFKHGIIQDWAQFNGRSMHPPEDNVNAVLSFLYTIILYRVDSAIESEALDPYVGYFHQLDYGKKALTFDLMEEYRTPIADTLTVSLFNLGILSEDDFETVTFSKKSDEYPLEDGSDEEEEGSIAYQEKKGVLLTKEGIKKVISKFEKKMETKLYYNPLLRQVSYKQLIREQVKHFKRVLNGEESEYKPLQIK
jgi:CRISPR-associated protein Cas1